MSDDRVKMTENERYGAARKRARQHICEIDELRAEYATSNEIHEATARHDREIAEILGDLNQPVVGSRGGPTA